MTPLGLGGSCPRSTILPHPETRRQPDAPDSCTAANERWPTRTATEGMIVCGGAERDDVEPRCCLEAEARAPGRRTRLSSWTRTGSPPRRRGECSIPMEPALSVRPRSIRASGDVRAPAGLVQWPKGGRVLGMGGVCPQNPPVFGGDHGVTARRITAFLQEIEDRTRGFLLSPPAGRMSRGTPQFGTNFRGAARVG